MNFVKISEKFPHSVKWSVRGSMTQKIQQENISTPASSKRELLIVSQKYETLTLNYHLLLWSHSSSKTPSSQVEATSRLHHHTQTVSEHISWCSFSERNSPPWSVAPAHCLNLHTAVDTLHQHQMAFLNQTFPWGVFFFLIFSLPH